jgi:hypothetical protein
MTFEGCLGFSQDWVRESKLIDEDDDMDAAIEDLWREKLDKQEEEYLQFENHEFLRLMNFSFHCGASVD